MGLAPLLMMRVFDSMKEINQQEGTAILLVEQNARLALQFAQRAYLLEHGEISLSGPHQGSHGKRRDQKSLSGSLGGLVSGGGKLFPLKKGALPWPDRPAGWQGASLKRYDAHPYMRSSPQLHWGHLCLKQGTPGSPAPL